MSLPAVFSSDTAKSLADVVAFHQKELPKLGWAAGDEPTLTDDTAVVEFSQGATTMTVTAIIDGGVTTVEVSIGPADTP